MSDQGDVGHVAELVEGYKEAFAQNKRILTFDDYLDLVMERPKRYCRDAATFVRDAFDHYGSYPVDRPWGQETRFAIFDVPWEDGRDHLVGQEQAQRSVYNLLKGFAHED